MSSCFKPLLCKLSFTLLCTTSHLYATQAGWSPAGIINNSATVTSFVTTCYDSKSNLIFSAFVNDSGNPCSQIYSGGAWQPVGTISDGTVSAGNGVFLCYDAQHNQVFASWADGATTNPMYAIFSGGSWTTGTITGTDTVLNDVTLSYDSTHGYVFAAWASASSSSNPAAMIYDGGWGNYSLIDDSTFANSNVFLTYNPELGQMFAAWGNNTDGNYPYYNTFSYSSAPSGSWGAASAITADDAGYDVYLDYIGNGLIFATWSTSGDSEWQLNNSIWTGSTWQPYGVIDETFDHSQGDFFSCYNTNEDAVYGAFSDAAEDSQPTYLVYSGTSWGATSPIDANYSGGNNVYLTYNNQDSSIFATWSDQATGNAMFSIYTSPPAPPTGLAGVQKVNNFGVVKEWCNVLSWTLSSSLNIECYLIYRNGNYVASVDGSTSTYQDHDQPKGVATTYSVYALGISSLLSEPVTIVVP